MRQSEKNVRFLVATGAHHSKSSVLAFCAHMGCMCVITELTKNLTLFFLSFCVFSCFCCVIVVVVRVFFFYIWLERILFKSIRWFFSLSPSFSFFLCLFELLCVIHFDYIHFCSVYVIVLKLVFLTLG